MKPLNAVWLQNALQTTCPHTSFTLEILSTIDSTNRYLLEKETKNFHICLAEQQTAGRGRMGKPGFLPMVQIYIVLLHGYLKNLF